MSADLPKKNATDPETETPDDTFEVSIPEALLDEAVKAVEQRAEEAKAHSGETAFEGDGGVVHETSIGGSQIVGEEVNVDVDSTVTEAEFRPDLMTLEELLVSGHLPDRVVLAFEEERARADEFQAQALQARNESQVAKEKLAANAADAEGFRRRVAREKTEAVKFANESVIKEILPVVDNLERAIQHSAPKDGAPPEAAGGIREGIEITLKQFHHLLQKLGVTRVPTDIGTPFDPRMHEGVTHQERDDIPPGSVAMVLQAGYLLHERLLRPAMVAVAKAKQAVAAPVAKTAATEDGDVFEGTPVEPTVESSGPKEATESKIERIQRAGRAAREARQKARAEREAAGNGAAPSPAEPSVPGTAEPTAPGDPDHEARAQARLARIRAAGAAAREARNKAREAKAAAATESEPAVTPVETAAAPVIATRTETEEEKIERVRRTSRAAREARIAARREREEREQTVSGNEGDDSFASASETSDSIDAAFDGGTDDDADESTVIESEADARAKARLERIRAAGAAAREGRLKAKQAKEQEAALKEAKAKEPAASSATVKPAKAAGSKPSFEDGDLDDWESTVDAIRTDKPDS